MKLRIVLNLVLLLLFVAAISGYTGYRFGLAQAPQGPPAFRTLEEALAGLTAELGLSAAQVEQVRPILQKRFADQVEQSRAVAERMNRHAAELRSVLDERQRALFDEHSRRIRDAARKHFQGGEKESSTKKE